METLKQNLADNWKKPLIIVGGLILMATNGWLNWWNVAIILILIGCLYFIKNQYLLLIAGLLILSLPIAGIYYGDAMMYMADSAFVLLVVYYIKNYLDQDEKLLQSDLNIQSEKILKYLVPIFILIILAWSAIGSYFIWQKYSLQVKTDTSALTTALTSNPTVGKEQTIALKQTKNIGKLIVTIVDPNMKSKSFSVDINDNHGEIKIFGELLKTPGKYEVYLIYGKDLVKRVELNI